jgi:hypothetical protein
MQQAAEGRGSPDPTLDYRIAYSLFALHAADAAQVVDRPIWQQRRRERAVALVAIGGGLVRLGRERDQDAVGLLGGEPAPQAALLRGQLFDGVVVAARIAAAQALGQVGGKSPTARGAHFRFDRMTGLAGSALTPLPWHHSRNMAKSDR